MVTSFSIHTERVRLLNEIQQEWEQNKETSATELARVESLLASAYDRHVCVGGTLCSLFN